MSSKTKPVTKVPGNNFAKRIQAVQKQDQGAGQPAEYEDGFLRVTSITHQKQGGEPERADAGTSAQGGGSYNDSPVPTDPVVTKKGTLLMVNAQSTMKMVEKQSTMKIKESKYGDNFTPITGPNVLREPTHELRLELSDTQQSKLKVQPVRRESRQSITVNKSQDKKQSRNQEIDVAAFSSGQGVAGSGDLEFVIEEETNHYKQNELEQEQEQEQEQTMKTQKQKSDEPQPKAERSPAKVQFGVPQGREEQKRGKYAEAGNVDQLKTSFLQTTSFIGERQYPLCMGGPIPKESPSKAACSVRIMRPRIKKLGFYKWEAQQDRAVKLQSQPWTTTAAQEEQPARTSLKGQVLSGHGSLTSRNNRTKILGGMPKNFVWHRGVAQLFVDQTPQSRPNLKELEARCLASRESGFRSGAMPGKTSNSMATRYSMGAMQPMNTNSQRTYQMTGSQYSQNPQGLSTGRGQQSSRYGSTAGIPQGLYPSIHELKGSGSVIDEHTPVGTLTYDAAYTDRLALLSDGNEYEELEDLDEQEYVYSTRSPDQKYQKCEQMAQRTKVFNKKQLTKSLMASAQFPELQEGARTARLPSQGGDENAPGWRKASRCQRRSKSKGDWQQLHSSGSSRAAALGKGATASFGAKDFSQSQYQTHSSNFNNNPLARNSQQFQKQVQSNHMGGSRNNKVILKRTEIAVDEENPLGRYEEIDIEVKNPNAGEGALSPLQLEPHELQNYMRMRRERREERRMQRNQDFLSRNSDIGKEKRQTSAQRITEQLKEKQAPATKSNNPVTQSRDIIKDNLEKGVAHDDNEFFEKYCQLHNSREFRNRDPDFKEHTQKEMMLSLHRTEMDYNIKLNGISVKQIEKMFGYDTQAESEKPNSKTPLQKRKEGPVGGLASKRMQIQAQKNKDRQKTIHTYRDRLLPRFHVD